MGKVPPETLRETVLENLGVKSEEVVLGPALGEDGSVVKVGDKVLISAMDPITGALDRIGWLAVNINANDVATFGIRPSFFSSCILLPEESTEKTVQTICRQIDSAAKKLSIAVIGGHSEVTPELNRPVVVGCAMGVTEPGRYVTSGGSRPGDKLILTKGAGLEGTAILATDKYEELRGKIDRNLVKSAMRFYDRISVVEEAVLAFNVGGVTAMHDPTEGGVAGGIHELADASGVGVRILESSIPVAPETSEICKFLEIDPLQLIGSGALLISARPSYSEKIIRKLARNNIKANVIGEFLADPKKRTLVHADGTVTDLVRPVSDHLWVALER
ncbi:MAG: AIR synthase family protein [Candidatus Bathyarchaeota archaeon]|nr:AIR synthase family protein [Candidatus Bathyarchaeota archaeon]